MNKIIPQLVIVTCQVAIVNLKSLYIEGKIKQDQGSKSNETIPTVISEHLISALGIKNHTKDQDTLIKQSHKII